MTELILQIGRQWTHDWDCYEALRDFYKSNFDIQGADYARPEDWWIKAPDLDFLRTYFRAEGFHVMPNIARRDMRIGDLLLMSIGANVISHCGVWVGNNWFYHAPFRETARKDLWAGFWHDKTLIVARHPKCQRPDMVTKVDLFDLLPPAQQRKYRELLKAHQVPVAGT